MLSPVRVTPPAIQPVSVAEAKAHLRIGHNDDDAQIGLFIAAATEHLDGYSGILGRALITQVWRVDSTCWRYPMRLPLGPVQTATIEYSNAANADAVLAPETFAVRADALSDAIYLSPGASWPSVYGRQDAVRVTFTAGYGATADKVPAPIRIAILMLVAHFYADREPIGSKFEELPFGPRTLLASYRRIHI